MGNIKAKGGYAMLKKQELINTLMENRRFTYEFFQRVYGHEPTTKLIEVISGQVTENMMSIYFTENAPSYEIFRELVLTMKTEPLDSLIEKLRDEYTRVFVGPMKLPAPPWESVYVNKEDSLFTQCTLDVRSSYLQYGFLPANYPNEPDDHLALEIDFIRHLTILTIEELSKNNYLKVKKLLEDQRQFLKNHLLLWVDDFNSRLSKYSHSLFYLPLTSILVELLKKDEELIQEFLIELPQMDSSVH